MDIKIGEKDILGYSGILLMAMSWWALIGFWPAVGIVGCFLSALGGEQS